jgi:hypothetical protein
MMSRVIALVLGLVVAAASGGCGWFDGEEADEKLGVGSVETVQPVRPVRQFRDWEPEKKPWWELW